MKKCQTEQTSHGRVLFPTSDRLCIGCGYNLLGTQIDSQCPECGISASLSTGDVCLEVSSLKWLETIRRGVYVKLATAASVTIAASFFLLLRWPQSSYWAHALVVVIVQAFWLWGTLCLTAQNPRVSRVERTLSLRVLTRTIAGIAFVGMVFEYTLGNSISARVLTLVLSPFFLLRAAGVFLEALYLRSLTDRTRRSALRAWLSSILCLGALQVVCTVGVLVTAAIVHAYPGTVQVLSIALVQLRSALVCLFVVCYAGVLVCLVSCLRESLSKARRRFAQREQQEQEHESG